MHRSWRSVFFCWFICLQLLLFFNLSKRKIITGTFLCATLWLAWSAKFLFFTQWSIEKSNAPVVFCVFDRATERVNLLTKIVITITLRQWTMGMIWSSCDTINWCSISKPIIFHWSAVFDASFVRSFILSFVAWFGLSGGLGCLARISRNCRNALESASWNNNKSAQKAVILFYSIKMDIDFDIELLYSTFYSWWWHSTFGNVKRLKMKKTKKKSVFFGMEIRKWWRCCIEMDFIIEAYSIFNGKKKKIITELLHSWRDKRRGLRSSGTLFKEEEKKLWQQAT